MREIHLWSVSRLRSVGEETRSCVLGRQKLFVVVGAFYVFVVSPSVVLSANVTVNAASNPIPVATTAYGMRTSVYDNHFGNPNVPGRLIESGVNTLRYLGGGRGSLL